MSKKSLISLIAGVLEVHPNSLNESSGLGVTDGWDSLKQFQIMAEIEQVYGVRFSFEQMEHGLSIGEIREVLAAKGIDMVL